MTAALLFRAGAWLWLAPPVPTPIEQGYFENAAAMASGHGLLMRSGVSPEGGASGAPSVDVIEFMKQREAAGGRIDASHPYPAETATWLPATLHPPGYSLLAYGLYRVGNYSGMMLGLRTLQIGAEGLCCLLIGWFASRLFDGRVGKLSAWVYALLPTANIHCVAFLPDTLHGLFVSAIFCLGYEAGHTRRTGLLLAASLVTGVACYFRSEYLLIPLPVCLCLWASHAKFSWVAGRCVAMFATIGLVLAPWVVWTHARVGKAYFTNSGGGASVYSALGEDPNNPWRIQPNDVWIQKDAESRGFAGPWSVEADEYYGRRVGEYLKAHPLQYAKLVVVSRLPLALVPPYFVIGARTSYHEFNFKRYQLEEGLNRWQVVFKYPGKVLRYMWPALLAALVSAMLLGSMLVLCVIRRREWRRLTWLIVPWAHVVLTMSLVKGVEPRNLAPMLVFQAIALAVVLLAGWAGVRTRKRAA